MDLIRITVNDSGQLSGILDLWVLLALGTVIFAVAKLVPMFRNKLGRQEFEVSEVELGIGTGKLKLKPNNDDLQIAYKLWVELRTRKLGLQFEEENDVIVEVYNSWYEFFRITRELIKSIPVTKVAGQVDTQRLVSISIGVLNKAIRPHLTKWQSRFRRWYETEIQKPEHIGKAPQDVQRLFPEYSELVVELKKTNSGIVAYARLLGEIIHVNLDDLRKTK
jgi:hypothetical protein